MTHPLGVVAVVVEDERVEPLGEPQRRGAGLSGPAWRRRRTSRGRGRASPARARRSTRSSGSRRETRSGWVVSSPEPDARVRTSLGIVVSVASAGDLLQWHLHGHILVTDGAFPDAGTSHPLETWDGDKVMKLFRERLLARLIERHAISEELAQEPLAWRNPGFSTSVRRSRSRTRSPSRMWPATG